MKNKLLSAILCGLLITSLAGCTATPPINSESPAESAVSADAASTTQTSDGKIAEPAPQTDAQEADTQSELAETQQPTEEEKEISETPPQQTIQPATPQPPKPAESKPAEQQTTSEPVSEQPESTKDPEPPAPTQTETPKQPEPEPAPTEPGKPTGPEPQQPEEPTTPAFDVGYWISFAKNYATSIGLELSPTAVECWDNPIIAGAHSKYLERDITDCLNCYKNIEGFTGVWIWAEPDGKGAYKLYIGYE